MKNSHSNKKYTLITPRKVICTSQYESMLNMCIEMCAAVFNKLDIPLKDFLRHLMWKYKIDPIELLTEEASNNEKL